MNTIEETKTRRRELERNISLLLESFERETGLSITAVRYHPIINIAVSDPSILGEGDKVDIDVSL